MTVLGGVWALGDGLDSWSDHSLALILDMSLDLSEPSFLLISKMGNDDTATAHRLALRIKLGMQ